MIFCLLGGALAKAASVSGPVLELPAEVGSTLHSAAPRFHKASPWGLDGGFCCKLGPALGARAASVVSFGRLSPG
eukprot:7115563-Heterocapsa_arctica.AAC.1